MPKANDRNNGIEKDTRDKKKREEWKHGPTILSYCASAPSLGKQFFLSIREFFPPYSLLGFPKEIKSKSMSCQVRKQALESV